mgnify:CR=1 FL=1
METLNSIINKRENMDNEVVNIMKELVSENLEVDLEKEDLQTVLETEITDRMISEIEKTIKTDTWDYFDIMKIIGIMG